jgi:membrane protease YdiL (CAAX protease family)
MLAAGYLPSENQTQHAPSFAQVAHLILVVPLAEELYFRGLLLEHLCRGFSGVVAVLICSLLFGLLHLPVGATFVTGGLSLLACILVLKSGSLIPAVQLHVTWNAVTQIRRIADDTTRSLWIIATAIVVAVLLAAMIYGGRQSDSTR